MSLELKISPVSRLPPDTEEICTILSKRFCSAKYKSTPDSEITNRVFPYRSNKELNTQIKLLAQLAGIPIRITMHTARHTFRNLLAEAEIFDIAVIKKMMGHSRNAEIDDTYYRATDKVLLKAKSKFELFLTENL